MDIDFKSESKSGEQSDAHNKPRLSFHRGSVSSRRSSITRQRAFVRDNSSGRKKWWKLTLRDWDDDEPQDWWFASIAIPLLAATIGPLANVLSISALVVYWRQCVSTLADGSNAAECPWDGDPANVNTDLLGISYADPWWCYNANVASLALGFVGNIFLLCNFTRRIRYIVALPVTIIMWLLASGVLIGLTVAMDVYVPPTAPQQIYSQGYWYAVMAAILYFTCSILLLVNMIGYFLGHYPQNFSLTDAQRTLILQTMMFFIWLAGGAGIFSALEALPDSGAGAAGLNFSYTNSLYFCDVTILTIGFGDMYPTSDAARGLLFPYAIGGIISLGLMVSSLTKFAGEIGSENIIHRHIERSRARTVGRTITSSLEVKDRADLDFDARPVISPLLTQRETTIRIDDKKEATPTAQRTPTFPQLQRVATMPLQRVATLVRSKPKLIILREEKDRFEAMRRIQADTDRFKKWYGLGVSVIAFGVLWCCGAVVFWQAETHLTGITYFQSLYFCYVSLLTVGFGDLAPKSNPGRAFFVVWSLIAIPTITLLVSYLGETIIQNFKQMTNAAADFTVLPKEGTWRAWIERHPRVKSWLLQRKEKKAAQRRIEEGLPVGPEEDEPEPPTIAQLAEDHLSHHELARKLSRAIKNTAKDAKDYPQKQYGYEEWVEFTRLIRFTAKLGEDEELDEQEGMIEWDWIGEDSPMMTKSSEAEFVLERLCESLNRYISGIAGATKLHGFDNPLGHRSTTESTKGPPFSADSSTSSSTMACFVSKDNKEQRLDMANEKADIEYVPTRHLTNDEPVEEMSVRRYLATRLSTLKPPMDKIENPFKVLALLNTKQWLFFLCAFIAWTWDAFDFFTVSLTALDISKTFNVSKADITWGITLVLMLRSVGAITFGLAADRYGRKWPFVVNNILFIVLELATGFCTTYQSFLGVRALFGIAMGGLYGNAAATALEDCPQQARGIISGMLQQGYAFGYLLATVFARALVDTTAYGWRPLYWFGATPPVLIIIFRLCLPETDSYIERQRIRASQPNIGKTFIAEGKVALRKHWILLIYLVLLMAGFNFMSHGSQDLYPFLLQNQYSFTQDQLTITQVVANLGAITGGTIIGYLSQKFGRRFSIIVASIVGGAILYPYCFINNERIMAAAFFEQAMVQGAWGVIPIHLMELSPGSFRTFVVGTSYQLGNLASSASSTIEATIGERFPLEPLKNADGSITTRYEYGKVMAIFMGCVFVYVILLTFLGPEHKNRSMDADRDSDLEQVTGHHDEGNSGSSRAGSDVEKV